MSINDTTFFSSSTNFTIHVDSMVLGNVTVTATEIILTNVTSLHSNFSNQNLTFVAVANFVGLDEGLTIHNVNTSTNLFNGTGTANFNAPIGIGELITIIATVTVGGNCSAQDRLVLNLVVLFEALGILAFVLLLLFTKGKLSFQIDPKMLVIVFVGIVISIVMLIAVSDQIVNFCG